MSNTHTAEQIQDQLIYTYENCNILQSKVIRINIKNAIDYIAQQEAEIERVRNYCQRVADDGGLMVAALGIIGMFRKSPEGKGADDGRDYCK